jgi:AraC-like DNA-binding protein
MNIEAVESLLKRYPSLPVVAYVFLTPASFAAISHLSRGGLQNVILQRFEDSPRRFRETVERARGNPLKRKLLDGLRPQVSQLPLKLAATVDDMLEYPHRYRNAQDVAKHAGISTLQLYRSFSIAGLGSPRLLLRASKLLKAIAFFGDRGYSVPELARKIGYRNARTFVQHTAEVFGMTPARMRSHLAPDEAVEKLLAWLTSLPEGEED